MGKTLSVLNSFGAASVAVGGTFRVGDPGSDAMWVVDSDMTVRESQRPRWELVMGNLGIQEEVATGMHLSCSLGSGVQSTN